MTQRETLEWLWFSLVMGIGAEIEPVLSALGSPHELYQYRETNDFSAILTAAQCSRLKAVQLEDAADLLIRCAEQGVRILPFPHAEYPQKLREIPDAPPVLYAVGDTALLNEGCAVAIVGSRRPSAYGRQAAAEIAKGLCDANVTIVSGMADGLDSVAHQTALQQNAKTIAVMGTGHEQCYPPRNARMRAEIEKTGLVISEIPPNAKAYKTFFSLRNRIIAALSDAVCIVEAPKHSGTMHTAKYAKRYGRTLFAVPGSIFSPLSEGTNELLRKGAEICLGARSILDQLGIEGAQPFEMQSQPEQSLSADAQRVAAALKATPQNIGMLCDATGLAVWQLTAALTELELCGKAVQIAGRQYMVP